MKLGRLILAAAVLLVGAAIFVPLDLVAEDTPPPPPPAKAKEPAPPPPPAKAGKEELVEPPRMIKLVEPAYPEKAKQARIEGTVKLAAVVDASGTVIKVVKVQEIDGHPEFTKAAVEALQMCEFEPGTVDGEATTMKTIVTMKFELD